jgi:hypothetical protein
MRASGASFTQRPEHGGRPLGDRAQVRDKRARLCIALAAVGAIAYTRKATTPPAGGG